MSRELLKSLKKNVREAGRIRRGEIAPSRVFTYDAVDVRRLRESVHVSQAEFAQMIGVSTATVRNWEQGRRSPQGPARALLRVFEKSPKAVVGALS